MKMSLLERYYEKHSLPVLDDARFVPSPPAWTDKQLDDIFECSTSSSSEDESTSNIFFTHLQPSPGPRPAIERKDSILEFLERVRSHEPCFQDDKSDYTVRRSSVTEYKERTRDQQNRFPSCACCSDVHYYSSEETRNNGPTALTAEEEKYPPADEKHPYGKDQHPLAVEKHPSTGEQQTSALDLTPDICESPCPPGLDRYCEGEESSPPPPPHQEPGEDPSSSDLHPHLELREPNPPWQEEYFPHFQTSPFFIYTDTSDDVLGINGGEGVDSVNTDYASQTCQEFTDQTLSDCDVGNGALGSGLGREEYQGSGFNEEFKIPYSQRDVPFQRSHSLSPIPELDYGGESVWEDLKQASHAELLLEWSMLCQECSECWSTQDLQLAAELGKTLLERNRELENSIKHHQAVIDDQSQEIEYLTKQTVALREVNESRVRVYEQLEISLQEAETLNSRLLEESASDKVRIKSLSGIVENLEQKCEDLQSILQETKLQVEAQSVREKKERRRSSNKEVLRKSSSLHRRRPEVDETDSETEPHSLDPLLLRMVEGGGVNPPEIVPKTSSQHSGLVRQEIISTNGKKTLNKANEKAGVNSTNRKAQKFSTNGGSRYLCLVSGSGTAHSKEERLLELEVVELNDELERMTELRREEAERILQLEFQVRGLVGENYSLSLEAGGVRGVEPLRSPHQLHSNREDLLPSTCLCAEVLKANCTKQMVKHPHQVDEETPSDKAARSPAEDDQQPARNPLSEDEYSAEKKDIEEISSGHSVESTTQPAAVVSGGSNAVATTATTNTKPAATTAVTPATTEETPTPDYSSRPALTAIQQQLGMIIEKAVDKVKSWDLKDDESFNKPNFKIGSLCPPEDSLCPLEDLVSEVEPDDLRVEGARLEARSLQEELKMSGQYELESDTLSSGFSEGSEHKYSTKETQTDCPVYRQIDKQTTTDSQRNRQKDRKVQGAAREDERMKLKTSAEGNLKMNQSNFESTPPQYRDIFREMFRVLEEAKRNPDNAANGPNQRRLLEKGKKSARKVVDHSKSSTKEEFPTLLPGEPLNSNAATGHSYAEILRKGIKK